MSAGLPERTATADELAAERAKTDRAARQYARPPVAGPTPQKQAHAVRLARSVIARFDQDVNAWLDSDAAEPAWEQHAWALREQVRQLAELAEWSAR